MITSIMLQQRGTGNPGVFNGTYWDDGSGLSGREQTLLRLLRNNAGIRFSPPDKWFGNRPIFYTDDEATNARRIANRAWMFDPEGFSVVHGGEPGAVTEFPSTFPAGGLDPVSWDLPASTAPEGYVQTAEQATALEAQFNTATINRRSPITTPSAVFIPPVITLPLARVNPVTSQPGQAGAPTTASGLNVNRTPPPDASPARYLTNGRIVDANGAPVPNARTSPQVLPTNNTTVSAVRNYEPYIIGLAVLAVLYALSRRKS